MLNIGFTFAGVIVRQGRSYTSPCLELDVASQGNTIRAAKDAFIEAALYLESAMDINLPYIRPVPLDEDPRHATPKLVVQTFPLKPILKRIDNIKEIDAILAYAAHGKPIEPEWHEADFIVGNPPFLGGKLLRANLGDQYVEDVFALYDGRVPREADLVCYWFEEARAE